MKQKEIVTMYIATHKKINKPDYSYYIPIRVGAHINKNDFGYLRDDIKNNISSKNQNYSELTAIYWIWKNDKSNIVGINHYRRYFFNSNTSYNMNNVITKEKITNILNNYDIVVPQPIVMIKDNVYTYYKRHHYIKDLNICEDIILKEFPEYHESYLKILNRHYYFPCNMFICKKVIFDKYMSWLFEILFKLEKEIDISNYDDYNKRVYGFISERLFNVWLEKNKQYKIKIMPMANIEENLIKQKIKYLEKIIYLKLLSSSKN